MQKLYNPLIGIKLEETMIPVWGMLIPWQKLWILTCLENSIKLSQSINLEQLIELYIFTAIHNYSKGNEKILKRVWQNLQTAKTFSEFNVSTSEHKRDYTWNWISQASNILQEWREIFCFIDFAYRVSFYTQSQIILMMLGSPRRFLWVHGVWINLKWMALEYSGIKFYKIWKSDYLLFQLKKIYNKLVKWLKHNTSILNPSTEKVIELIKVPNSEILISTNNHWSVTSVHLSKYEE